MTKEKSKPRARRSQAGEQAIKSERQGRNQTKTNRLKKQLLYIVSHVLESRETCEIQVVCSMATPLFKNVNSVMVKTIEKPLRKVLEDSIRLTIDKACSTTENLRNYQRETIFLHVPGRNLK
ncbi:hypothetical protein ES707_14554 [subsurface metagenome]